MKNIQKCFYFLISSLKVCLVLYILLQFSPGVHKICTEKIQIRDCNIVPSGFVFRQFRIVILYSRKSIQISFFSGTVSQQQNNPDFLKMFPVFGIQQQVLVDPQLSFHLREYIFNIKSRYTYTKYRNLVVRKNKKTRQHKL